MENISWKKSIKGAIFLIINLIIVSFVQGVFGNSHHYCAIFERYMGLRNYMMERYSLKILMSNLLNSLLKRSSNANYVPPFTNLEKLYPIISTLDIIRTLLK